MLSQSGDSISIPAIVFGVNEAIMVFMSDDNLSASARNEYDTIVIKVGTKVITNKKGYLDMEQIQNLARQINDLKKYYKRIILVTSGAVAAGREVLGKKARKNESVSTQ